jgi:hypothetical protein
MSHRAVFTNPIMKIYAGIDQIPDYYIYGCIFRPAASIPTNSSMRFARFRGAAF